MANKTFSDYFEITSSKRVFKSEWKLKGVPFYRAREIVKLSKYGYVENELFISDEMYDKYAAKYGVPKTGDILVTAVGTLGICYNVKANDKFYFKDGNIIWFKKKNEIDSRYVEYLFRSEDVIKQVNGSVGAVVGTFTIEKAKKTKIPVPSLLEQQAIVEKLDTAFELIDRAKANIEQNIQNAKELLQSKLNQVFSENSDVSQDWYWVQLGKVCKTGAGGTPLKSKNEYYDNGNIPWLLSGEVNNRNITKSKNFITEIGLENSSARMFPKDSVLIAMYGATAGQVGILRIESASNQAVCAIYPNDNYIPDFLFYTFLFKKKELIGKAVGNAQPNISQIKIKETEVPFIDVETQDKIVAQLDELSEQTEQLQQKYRQKIANLEELKKSILEKAFKGELTN